ncbi:MAG: hypothetical protein ABIA04_11860 [Pseudomonadota bacterium]
MKKSFLFLSILLFPVYLLASEGHADKEFIKGAGFDLVHVNHVLVGTYNLIPVWAEKECGSHIKGQYKTGEEIKEFGVIAEEGKPITGYFEGYAISFSGLDPDNKIITLNINDDLTNESFSADFQIRFEFEDFADGHMKNITFYLNNGKEDLSVKLEGECCYGSAIFYSILFFGLSILG